MCCPSVPHCCQVKTLEELLPHPSTPALLALPALPAPPVRRRKFPPVDNPQGQSCTDSPAMEFEGGNAEASRGINAEASRGINADHRMSSSSISEQLPVGDLSIFSECRKNTRGDFIVKDNVKTIVSDAWSIASAQGHTAEGLLRLRWDRSRWIFSMYRLKAVRAPSSTSFATTKLLWSIMPNTRTRSDYFVCRGASANREHSLTHAVPWAEMRV